MPTTPDFSNAVRRPLTTVFIDLVGSTQLSILLDGEEYANVIDEYRGLSQRLAAGHDGFVAADEGDGRFVWFGWPTARLDDAERAVEMSKRLVAELQPLSDRVEGQSGRGLQVRIGIHTGTTIVSSGVEPGFADVTGATVNLAAKVQARALPGQVIITEATASTLTRPWRLESAGSLEIEELQGAVELVEVVDLIDEADQLPGSAPSPDDIPGQSFIGRGPEAARLLAGDESVIAVVGPPGVGKSALLDHCASKAAVAQQLTIQGVESLQASPLEALTDALTTLDIDFDRNMADPVDRMAALVKGLAAQDDLLIVVEDAQWLDQSSLAAIERAAGAPTRGSKMTVWLAARSVPELNIVNDENVIYLQPLSTDDAGALVALAAPGLARSEADSVLERAEGNPFFLWWLARAAEDDFAGVRQVLKPRSGMPVFVQQALRAEIDHTGVPEELTTTAATIGVEFGEQLLSATLRRPLLQVRSGLDRLAERGLVRSTGAEGHHRFSHALIRDLAYDLMLTPERVTRHRQVAETLVETDPGADAVIGFHYDRAGDRGRAAEHLLAAARACRRSNAYHEGAMLASRVLELAGDPANAVSAEITIEARSLAASLSTTLDRYPDRGHTELRAELDELLDPRTETRWAEMARVRAWAGAIVAADLTESARLCYLTYRATQRGFPEIKDLNTNARGIATHYRGHFAHAERLLETSLDSIRANGIDPWLIDHWGTLDHPGILAYSYTWPVFDQRGRRRAAHRAIAESWDLAWRTPGGATTVAHMGVNTALYWQTRGDATRAMESARTVSMTAEELGLDFWKEQGQALTIIAEIMADPSPALITRIIDHAKPAAQMAPVRALHLYRVAADIAREVQAVEPLRAAVAAALEPSRRTKAQYLNAELLRLEAAADRIEGKFDRAQELLVRAATLARRQGARRFELRALTDLVELAPGAVLRGAKADRRLVAALAEFPEPEDDADAHRAAAHR